MAGHKIGHQVLIFVQPLINLFVSLFKGQVNLTSRLAHLFQNSRRHMLGGNFELPTDVVLT